MMKCQIAAVVLGFAMVAIAQDKPAAQPAATQAATTPAQEPLVYVRMQTSLGDILLELAAEKAPITVENFLDYVDAGFYNGTIFHRVMSNFMIQGGGYTPNLDEKREGLRPPIKNEWQNGLKNTRGSIAMARTQVADSATAQFFINVVDNAMLDQPRDGAAYAVFGRVIAGMDVVDKIRNTPVTTHEKLPMGPVVPKEPVVIKAVTRASKEEGQKAAKVADEARAKAESDARAATEKELAAFLAKAEQEHGKKFEKTASGLMYLVLQPGAGVSPRPTDRVTVHYTGTLLDGKKFDSSRDRGQPATFGLNQVIKGWTEGVGLMKPGARHILVIPGNLAYGPNPPPGSGITPNATLVFDVELLSVGG